MKQYAGLFFLVWITCSSQRHLITIEATHDYVILNTGIQFMALDPLGFIYLVDQDRRLARYDTSGSLLYLLTPHNLGTIHSLDVSNPLKILIFYKDQQTLVILDNTLSELQRNSLPALGFNDVTAVCRSADNAIWIFDGRKSELVKVNSSGQEILRSDPFHLTKPTSRRPGIMIDTGHELLLKEPGKHISVFNVFGKYQYSIISDVTDPLSLSNGGILFFRNREVIFLDWKYEQEIVLSAIEQKLTGTMVYEHAGQFFLADGNGVYKVNLRSGLK